MSKISKSGIGNGNTIQAEHITRIIDALDGTGSADIVATGSFTGSFVGSGVGLTGVVSSSYSVTASYASNVSPNVLPQQYFTSGSAGTNSVKVINGSTTDATGNYSVAVGFNTSASGYASHTEGLYNKSIGSGSHTEGIGNIAQLRGDAAIGTFNLAGAKKVDFYNNGGVYYNASLKTMYVTGDVTAYAVSASTITWMHSDKVALYDSVVASAPIYNGTYTSIVITSDPSGGVNDTFLYDYGYLVTERNTDAYPAGRLAHGAITTAWGRRAHSEGYYTQALGRSSHSEGQQTVANGVGSHAEGQNTYANGSTSHSEGYFTSASANYSHAEGQSTIAAGVSSHAEGLSTVSVGTYSHAEGIGTVASGSGQTAAGKYNTHGNTTSLFVIGNGSSDSVRGDLALFNSQSIRLNVPVTASIVSASFTGSLQGTASYSSQTNFLENNGYIGSQTYGTQVIYNVTSVSGSATSSLVSLQGWRNDLSAQIINSCTLRTDIVGTYASGSAGSATLKAIGGTLTSTVIFNSNTGAGTILGSIAQVKNTDFTGTLPEFTYEFIVVGNQTRIYLRATGLSSDNITPIIWTSVTYVTTGTPSSAF